MSVAEQDLRRADRVSRAGLSGHTAFGLTLVEAGASARGGRATRWVHVTERELRSVWSGSDARRTLDRRYPGGRLFLAVDHDERLGYLIRAPRFGQHIVAADGRTITSVLPRIAQWRWERPFLAQVLPLAAVLQGLEVFHASAVALGENVLAFIGAAGVGKTSTAAHLVGLGADFVTDDVLALETAGDAVVAHAGPPRLAIDRDEFRRIAVEARPALGSFLGASEKQHYAPEPIELPRRLSLVYFLRRAAPGAEPRIREFDEPSQLLGAPFIPHVQPRARLIRHLDICALIARTSRTFVIDVPPAFHAHAVAKLTLGHAEELL